MRIISWNVNGLRAATKKGFSKFLENSNADIIGLQEVRALPEQLDANIRNPKGWHTYFSPAQRLGYSGVAIYSKTKANRIDCSLGESRFDKEGRFIATSFGRMTIASIYFPKGSGKNRDNSRVPYKLDFYKAVFDKLQKMKRRGPVFVIGDYNTAHQEIDLARPASNKKSSGFLREERQEIDRWLKAGWIDTFRHQYPESQGNYTWWRQWGNSRSDNVGWRIDYVLASKSAHKLVRDAFIWPDQTGSDHCPVGVDLNQNDKV
tara:strand:+ start:236 stop:1021 length:786 start_codon:yes stop_codon:yes gene_type:complete